MRKIIILVLLISILFGMSFADENKKSSGTYSIQCYKCKELAIKNNYTGAGVCSGCPAWRMYALEKAGNFELIYHCQHGHELKINAKTGERN